MAAQQKALAEVEASISVSKERADALKKEIEDMKGDRSKQNAALIAAAERVKLAETAIAALEEKMGDLIVQELEVRGRLDGADTNISNVLAALELAEKSRLPVLGCCPMTRGARLNGYQQSGVRADHESYTPGEMLEKLRAGMHVVVRESSISHFLADNLRIVTEMGAKALRRISFCTDDVVASDILKRGHLDNMVRMAIAMGISPMAAIQMATINGADALRKILLNEYKLPSALRPDYPEPLQAIIVKALAPSPVERFATAEDMQVALEEWLISSGKLVTATDVAKCVKDRISPEMRARNDALLSQNRVAPELLASQLMKDVDSETPTAGSGLVTAPPGLWVGKPVAKPAAGELSVTEPGQPPSVTLPIAQPATPAIKPRASDATELVDFVPVKADGTSAAPAAAPKATPAALEAAPPAPRSARSAAPRCGAR